MSVAIVTGSSGLIGDEPITIIGDGSQTRSFCYADDLIEGIIRFMNLENGFVSPLNLGNPTKISILSLAEIISGLTGSCSSLVHKPLPEDDPRQRQPDIAMVNEKLAWVPEYLLEAGLLKN